jgi:hypothetical protein
MKSTFLKNSQNKLVNARVHLFKVWKLKNGFKVEREFQVDYCGYMMGQQVVYFSIPKKA